MLFFIVVAMFIASVVMAEQNTTPTAATACSEEAKAFEECAKANPDCLEEMCRVCDLSGEAPSEGDEPDEEGEEGGAQPPLIPAAAAPEAEKLETVQEFAKVINDRLKLEQAKTVKVQAELEAIKLKVGAESSKTKAEAVKVRARLKIEQAKASKAEAKAKAKKAEAQKATAEAETNRAKADKAKAKASKVRMETDKEIFLGISENHKELFIGNASQYATGNSLLQELPDGKKTMVLSYEGPDMKVPYQVKNNAFSSKLLSLEAKASKQMAIIWTTSLIVPTVVLGLGGWAIGDMAYPESGQYESAGWKFGLAGAGIGLGIGIIAGGIAHALDKDISAWQKAMNGQFEF